MYSRMLFLATCFMLVSPTTSGAEPAVCSSRADILSQLSQKYKEAPVAVGLANSGALIEVLTSSDGTTWTIVLSMPNGTTCLIAAGSDWQATPVHGSI